MRRGLRVFARAFAMLAHLRAVGFELRELLRSEQGLDLRVQCLSCLRVGLAASRMRLTELIHQALDLGLLLLRQVQVLEPAHSLAMTMAVGA